jgi:hypothetical protein
VLSCISITDNFFENRSVSLPAGPHGHFGFPNRADCPVQEAPLLLEHLALHAQGVGQRQRLPVQQQLDLPQRKPEELQRNDLLQPFQVGDAVETIAGAASPGPEQVDVIVMVQGTDGNARHLRELLDTIQHFSAGSSTASFLDHVRASRYVRVKHYF